MENGDNRTGRDAALVYPRGAVALRDLDSKSLEASASGGAFPVFARAVIARGGAVFGAALLEGGEVRHVCARSLSELRLLQGSKYVRSEVGDTYRDCAELLGAGTEVLYSGTPCQIAALRGYLAKRLSPEVLDRRLLCIDLICHGTPKQDVFKAYMEWLSVKERADDGIRGYVFRSKKMGWGLYYYYYYFRNGRRHEVLGPARDDPYFSAFAKGLIYRRCCYKCPYARLERVGDVTIGDYWGVENVHPDFHDERGVSAVLLNTERGEAFFFEHCKDSCEWVTSDPEDIAAYNANLVSPADRSAEGEKLADEVERAVAAGDYEMAFGRLLAPRLSKAAKIRRRLPWKLVRALGKFKASLKVRA